MPNRYHNLFVDQEDPHFTADVLGGKYQNHRGMGKNHGLEKLILPLDQISEEVHRAARSIMETKKWEKNRATEFIQMYHEKLNSRLIELAASWEFPEKHYADDYGVTLMNADLFGDEAATHIRAQKAQGLVGKYAEFLLARIVNGMILDMNGSLADIIVKLPGKRRILIESKSARLTNNGKYKSLAGNINQVSRNGIFIKRNQIWAATQEILQNPRDLSYTALIDYEFIGGENMTFGAFVSKYPEIFESIGKIEDLYEIERRLRKVITIKSITMLPTWSIYDTWNRFVEKTRPVRWGSFKTEAAYPNSSSIFGQYLEQSQNREIRSHLEALGIPHHTHTLTGLQKAPLHFESYGFKFLPASEIEYPARKNSKALT